MNVKDRFALFLYLLMRDDLAVGVVERILGDVEKVARQLTENGEVEVRYSSAHLSMLARDQASRLMGEES